MSTNRVGQVAVVGLSSLILTACSSTPVESVRSADVEPTRQSGPTSSPSDVVVPGIDPTPPAPPATQERIVPMESVANFVNWADVAVVGTIQNERDGESVDLGEDDPANQYPRIADILIEEIPWQFPGDPTTLEVGRAIEAKIGSWIEFDDDGERFPYAPTPGAENLEVGQTYLFFLYNVDAETDEIPALLNPEAALLVEDGALDSSQLIRVGFDREESARIGSLPLDLADELLDQLEIDPQIAALHSLSLDERIIRYASEMTER